MTYTTFEQLPLVLSVEQLAQVLEIGKTMPMNLYAAVKYRVSVSGTASEFRRSPS